MYLENYFNLYIVNKIIAMAGWKDIEKLDAGGDFAKELSSFKKEILWAEKKEKTKKELSSLQKEIQKEIMENDEVLPDIEAMYEKPTPKETYSWWGGGKTTNTEKYTYDPDDWGQDAYTLPQRSLAAKVGIKNATANVERDITDMASSILWKKTWETVAERFIA